MWAVTCVLGCGYEFVFVNFSITGGATTDGPKKPTLCGNTTDTVAGAATGGVAIVAANVTANYSTNLSTVTTPGKLNTDGSSVPMPNGVIALAGVTSGVPSNPSTTVAVAHPPTSALTNKPCDTLDVSSVKVKSKESEVEDVDEGKEFEFIVE